MSEYKGKEDIDMIYYDGLVEDAKEAIAKVGDINIIVDPIPVGEPRPEPETTQIPF